jgi:hypothetical protein
MRPCAAAARPESSMLHPANDEWVPEDLLRGRLKSNGTIMHLHVWRVYSELGKSQNKTTRV